MVGRRALRELLPQPPLRLSHHGKVAGGYAREDISSPQPQKRKALAAEEGIELEESRLVTAPACRQYGMRQQCLECGRGRGPVPRGGMREPPSEKARGELHEGDRVETQLVREDDPRRGSVLEI